MLKWIFGGLGVLVVIAAGAAWWLLLSGSKAPATAPGLIDMAAIRTLAEAPPSERPTGVRILEIGNDSAPNFAIQAGRLGGKSKMSYNAVIIDHPQGTLLVGGGIDMLTSRQMAQSDAAVFDPIAYESILDAAMQADQVLITHEHLDHVMAIARHPVPTRLAPKLVLNAPQIASLPQFMSAKQKQDWTDLDVQPKLDGTSLTAIAPGVVVVPASGHTAGSQMVFISQADGREILLIGDIAWSLSNIEDLSTRPVLTQYVVFDPNEVRANVKAQLRALHDLMAAEPDLAIVPAHDRSHLEALASDGVLTFYPAETYAATN